MFGSLVRFFGGYAFRRRDLRLLYASVFLSVLGSSTIFPLRLLYAQEHGASPTQLGLMASAFLVAGLVMQVPMGWLVDHWGRVPVLILSLGTHAAVSALYIVLSTPDDLIVLRFVEGMTVSAFRPAVNAYIADVTPEEHRSEAYGGYGAVLNGGILIGPLAGGVLAQSLGFPFAFGLTSALEVLALFLVWGRVVEPLHHRAEQDIVEHISPAMLFTLPLVGAYAAQLGLQVAMSVLGALWSIWIHDLGGQYIFIGFTFAIFALPQIFLGAPAGRLADRTGRAYILLLSGLTVGLIYALYGFMTNLVLILAVGLVEGAVVVFQQPVALGFLASASPSSARGRVQGLSGAIASAGGAAAAFVSLPLYHRSHAYPFVLAGLVTGSAAVLAAIGAQAQARRGVPSEEQAA